MADNRPLAIDLFCGLGGWTEGLLALGYRVVGYDIEAHEYGDQRNPGEFVLRDVLTIHGGEFKDAALIVASPPCQFFSYTAMPWSRAKQLAADVRADPARLEKELALFNACFRIQREACEAAGRHIPMVVENVRGAIPWVGRGRGSFGSFHLWGDVPALMPKPVGATKVPGFRFDGNGGAFQSASVEGMKNQSGGSWFGLNPNGTPGALNNARDGRKHRDIDGYERTHPNAFGWKIPRTTSKGAARKAASAMIAKIPEPLSRHIGTVYWPADIARAA